MFPNIQSYPECAHYTCTFIVELCERELCLHCKVRGTGPSVGPWDKHPWLTHTQMLPHPPWAKSACRDLPGAFPQGARTLLSCSFCTASRSPLPIPLYLELENRDHPLETPAKQKTQQWDHCGCQESPGNSQGVLGFPAESCLAALWWWRTQGVFLHSSSCQDGAAGRATQQLLLWCPDTLTESWTGKLDLWVQSRWKG